MNNNLDDLEDKLKKEDKQNKKHRVSGRSVFDLQKIIKEKSDKDLKSQENDKQ